MKRFLSLLFLLSCWGGSVFGVGLSGGLELGYISSRSSLYGTQGTTKSEYTTVIPALNFGIFLDATYAQACVGYATTLEGTSTTKIGSSTTSASMTNRFTLLPFEVLAKYPVRIGPVQLFPLLGLEYDLNLTMTDSTGADLKASLPAQQRKDLSAFFVKGGAGVDVNLTKRFYLRPEILFGYKIPTKTDQDQVASTRASGYTDVGFPTTRWDFRLLAGYGF